MTEKLFCPLVNAFVVVGHEGPLNITSDFIQQTPKSVTPAVLECFPASQKEWDVVQSMPMFCLPDGIQIRSSSAAPVFFANTLTMGNGDRHYSFCLKFFDETKVETTNHEKKFPIFAKDDISHKASSERKTAKEIWDKRSSNTLYRCYTRNASANDIKLAYPTDTSPNHSGHPLGALGTNLDEQIKYRQQQRGIHEKSNNFASDPDSEIDLNTTELTSLDKLQSQARRKIRVLKRRESSFIFSSRNSQPNVEGVGPEIPITAQDDSNLILDGRKSSVKAVTHENKFATKALVILSEFPYCTFFKEYLTQLYEYMVKLPIGKCQMIPIERFISNLLFEVILPPPGNDLCLVVHAPVSPLFLCSPSFDDLPLLDMSLEPLLLCLDQRNLMKVFIGLTLERKFLFTSSNSNLLYHCTHALLSLLYPFEWQTGYVPVVPPTLLELTQALTPIILGVSSNYISELEIPDEMIVVDLDSNTVTISEHNLLPDVPNEVLRNLRRALKRELFPQLQELGQINYSDAAETLETIQLAKKQNHSRIRLCFLAFFVSLLRDMRKFVNVELEDTADVFDVRYYLDTQVTTNADFWEILLHTRMFEIFTQTLANEDEASSTMGLFMKLATTTETCKNVKDIFDAVLAQPTQISIPKIHIPLNNPRAGKEIQQNWTPNHFPSLDASLGICIPDNSTAMTEIKKLQSTRSAQLYVLRVHFLMQQFHYERNMKTAHNALCLCVVALELDVHSIPRKYISSLLEIFSDKDLNKIASSNATGIVAEETHEILESRKYSMPTYDPELDSEQETDAELTDDIEEFKLDLNEIPGSHSSRGANLNIIDSFIGSLSSLAIPSKGAICTRQLLQSLVATHLVPDDLMTLSKLSLVLQNKNGKISRKLFSKFLRSMHQVLLDCVDIQSKHHNIFEPSEIALFSSSVSQVSSVNKSGHLLLTQERLLFLSKGKLLSSIRLENIQNVETQMYSNLRPGGMPGIKIITNDTEFCYSIRSSWNPTHLRDIWVSCISDFAGAWKMATYFKEPPIIFIAIQNFILSATLIKRTGTKYSPGRFQFFGECFPDKGWFRIPELFNARGMMNIDTVCELQQIDNQSDSTLYMLQKAIQLIHTHRSPAKQAREYVNFKALKESKEFREFSDLTCNLQRFSLDGLSPEEVNILFVNLYNILVLHSYMEHEKFPENIWEWKYMERTAYYTIGGVAYSLWDIHHGILRENKPSPGGGKDLPFYVTDPRLATLNKVALSPKILFALSNHTLFAPSVFRLEATSFESGLTQAADLYCQNNISFEEHRIKIPALLKDYCSDFTQEAEYSEEKLIVFVKQHLTSVQRKMLDSIYSFPDFEIEWLRSWVPSAKVLVGAV